MLEVAKKIAVALQKNDDPPADLADALRKSHPHSHVIPDKKMRGWLFYDRARNELWHLEVDGEKCTAYDSLDWDRFLAVERMVGKGGDAVMAKVTASLIKADDLREKAAQMIAAAKRKTA